MSLNQNISAIARSFEGLALETQLLVQRKARLSLPCCAKTAVQKLQFIIELVAARGEHDSDSIKDSQKSFQLQTHLVKS